MANLLLQNPIILVTTQTDYKAAVLSTLGAFVPLMIRRVLWLNPKNAGDKVILIDPQSGSHLLDLVASTNVPPVILDWSAGPKQWANFACIQFDSGELQIFTV